MNSPKSVIALSLIAIFAISIAIQPILPATSEKYSALGLLGPNQQVAGFPTNVTTGQSFRLYAYVTNHEGVSDYFQILIKLGNQNTLVNKTAYARAPILASYSQVLLNNQSWTFPMNLSINSPGNDQKLVFELWSYNVTSSIFQYTGRYDTLYLNVTTT